MTLFVIRPARKADVAALALIAAQSYRFGFAGIMSEEALAARGEAFFAARFAEQWPTVSLIERPNGEPVGFAQVRQGTLDMFFLAPRAAGSGAAPPLLAEAEGRGAVRLECFAANARARRFYERHGWTLASSYSRELAGEILDFVTYEKPARASA